MITINMRNNTGLDYNTVWNAMVRAISGDKIVKSRNLRLHDHKHKEGIISITACNKKPGKDCVIDVLINDISVMRQVAESLIELDSAND